MPLTEPKELVLDSSFEEVEKIEPFLGRLQKWAEFGDEDFARIMLTLSEAATNAIVHGNREDPDKKVKIVATLDNSTLEISVKDEGEGFSPDQIPDPLQKENLLKEGGRGVYLIQQYADKVTFSEKGTKLTMVFNLGGKS